MTERRRVVVALDSFKGSITAAAASAALARGWHAERPEDEVVLRPMADGGEGSLDAFATAVPGAERVSVTVTGPDGRPADAAWLLLPATPDAPAGTGVAELASTSGIELLGGRLRPWDADTTGFGEAIVEALDHGVSRLVLGIGSSASTDGGLGMLRALGARFLDPSGAEVGPGARGLAELAAVDLAGLRPLPPGGAVVLTDVDSPLLGPSGAAAVFGPQKGLDAAGVALADAGLARLADLLASSCRSWPHPAPGSDHERQLGAGPAGAAGAGAAGGTGFGLAVWGAELVPGAPEVAALVGLRDAVAAASVVVTGEGSFDGQSAAGKVPSFVAALAAAAGVPVAVVAGRITPDAATAAFASALSLTDLAGSPEASLADPARWLHAAGAALARAG